MKVSTSTKRPSEVPYKMQGKNPGSTGGPRTLSRTNLQLHQGIIHEYKDIEAQR